MTFKVYLTIEMPGEYGTKGEAIEQAIESLRSAVTVFDPDVRARASLNLVRGSAIEARVFESGKIMSGAQHDFIVDICDGAI